MTTRRLSALAVFALLTACGGGSAPQVDAAGSPGDASAALQAPKSLATRTYENGQLVSRDAADTPAQVFRLYKAAFNRESDPTGLGFHVGHIESVGEQLTDIAGNFVASPEFLSRYGTLTNDAFVIQLYLNVLGRAPDASGQAFHVGNLASGTLSRAQTLVGFSESPENKTNTAAAVTAGIRYVPWQPPVASDPFGVGAVANSDVVAIPAGTSFADSFVATNNGLYMRLFDATGPTAIMKLHGDPTFSNAFTTVNIGKGELMTWAPSDIRTEDDREMSVYYVMKTDDPANPNKSISNYHYYTENSGGVAFTEEDDRGILRILGGSGPEAGIFAFRPWAKTAFGLYAEGVTRNATRLTSDRFREPVVDPDQPINLSTGIRPPLDLSASVPMVVHPKDAVLFAGEGNTLYEIGGTHVISKTELPAASNGFASISNMLWANGELYFAYDGKVWRRSTSGQIAEFATVDALLGGFGAQDGLFCIQGGELLMRGGTAKSIFWGTERPWLIRPGALSPDQALKSVYLQVLTGVYCTPEGNGVYGIAANNVVFIRPLP